MYYKFASPTARRFVELGFYSNYFGDRTDPELYTRCRDEIAASLTESDIRYLLRFESDPDTKVYLNALLDQPPADEPPAQVQPKSANRPQPTTRPKPPAKPRFPVKRKKARSRLAGAWAIGQDSSGGTLLKILAALVIISAAIIIGGIIAESMARTVDLLRDVLPPETVARAKRAVWEKELEVYVGIARDLKVAEENGCSWLWGIYNWNAACNFYMVSSAVYLLDDPRLRAECIELAERSVPCYLQGFSKDGLSLEGPSYWDYGFGCYR